MLCDAISDMWVNTYPKVVALWCKDQEIKPQHIDCNSEAMTLVPQLSDHRESSRNCKTCYFVLHVAGCRFSYSTLGPVSAQVGDRLWTGEPPQCGTRHPGLLSLSLLTLNEYLA